MTIKTRGIVEAGSEFRLPAGFFQGLTLASVAGPAFEFTEAGAAVAASHTFGAGVVVIRRADDGSSDDSVFTLTEPGDGSGGADGRGIASMTISGGRLTGAYTDGTAWDAGTLPSGPTGAKGDKGDKGDPGPAATITVGTVTTGAAGTQASVTNSGSSSAAVLNFTIPRGADGTGGSGSSLDPEAVQDIVGAMVRAGTGASVSYDDAAGTLTISATGGGGGGSLPSRQTASVTTSTLANGASEDALLPLARSYLLQRLTASHPAWVRLYLAGADRTADGSRPQTQDPEPGSGVVAELIGTAARWPGVPGWDDKGSPDGLIPVRVTNLSGAARALTLTAQFLAQEA